MKRALLALVILLGAAAGFTSARLWPATRLEGPRRLLDASAAEIVRIELPGGTARLDGPDRWLVTWPSKHPSDSHDITWPGDTTRLRSLARLLASVTAIPGEAARDQQADSPDRSATIFTRSGERTTLRFVGLALGGRVPVRVEPNDGESWSGLVDVEVSDLLADGPLAWRSFAALPGMPLEPASIEHHRFSDDPDTPSLRLDRLGTQWAMKAPVQASASADAATLTARQLAALSGEAILDELGSDDALEASQTQWGAWTVRDARREGAAWTIEHLGPLSETTDAVRCAMASASGEVLWGPVTLEVSEAESSRLDSDPAFYLDARALRASPGDVRALTIEGPEKAISLTRRVETGWVNDALGPTAGASALAELLCAPASGALLMADNRPDDRAEQQLDLRPSLRVRVNGDERAFRVGLMTTRSGIEVGIQHAGVLRTYRSARAAEVWRWLDALGVTD